MDNATIHTGGTVDVVNDLLWDTIIDRSPLHVLVIYLPTRSPELNPIELIFHILARRIRSNATSWPVQVTRPWLGTPKGCWRI
jgi:transposase